MLVSRLRLFVYTKRGIIFLSTLKLRERAFYFLTGNGQPFALREETRSLGVDSQQWLSFLF